MRRITVDQRRARLGARHHLAASTRADDPVTVATDLVALHGTDPASVFLACAARMGEPTATAIERAIYEERALVRVLGMRRTMFVVPTELAPVVEASSTRAIAVKERRQLEKFLGEAGIVDAPTWLKETEEATVQALARRGEATGADLSADEPRLRTQLTMAPGKAYEAKVNITTRVLFLLAADGRIVRGRPRGSWISSQFHWSPVEAWLPDGMTQWDTTAAKAELVRRWLGRFGPGTTADLRWWTGWTVADVQRALATIGPAEVELDSGTGFVLADDVDQAPDTGPWVALLPALDPTVMGWSQRDWYLGEHSPTLFDRNGNAGPTVWCDGRIVGGWAQRKTGEVVYRLLEDVGRTASDAIDAAAGRLETWLGDIRVTPRFRTPLERDLVSENS